MKDKEPYVALLPLTFYAPDGTEVSVPNEERSLDAAWARGLSRERPAPPKATPAEPPLPEGDSGARR